MFSFMAEQYEAYPYPYRNPEEETIGKTRTHLNDFPEIAHYRSGGLMTFDKDYRVLVAGGGTGDATVHLAQEMARYCPDAELVHLDLSSSSINVAKKRLEKIGLGGRVTFIQDSLLNLPQGKYGEFDHIDCSGVLHHQKDPLAGAKALRSVLKPNGMMGIMLYGLYGRLAVYEIQKIMKEIYKEGDSLDDLIRCVRQWIHAAPATHPFKQALMDVVEKDDNEIVDMFLHVQDRAYTVPDLYDLWDRSDLELVTLRPEIDYNVCARLPEGMLRDRILEMPLAKQQAYGEQLYSAHAIHLMYVRRKGETVTPAPRPQDHDMIPYILPFGLEFRQQVISIGLVNLQPYNTQLDATHMAILSRIDNETPIKDILKSTAQALGKDKALIEEAWLTVYEEFRMRGFMVLHKFP